MNQDFAAKNANLTSADLDPVETQEWLDSLSAVIHYVGPERAKFLLQQLNAYLLQRVGSGVFTALTTKYINSISVQDEPKYPGDLAIEKKLQAYDRWNAMMMVLRAGKKAPELGGHIATFASAATLYGVGLNHFFRGATKDFSGDLLYIQGHVSPGIYARSFLEGRLSQEQLDGFRQEVENINGLSSYPHSWLMPEYWQFATVSMGLGPLQAIYQARFLHYLRGRGLADTSDRKVWCFCGDGEMDEPESLGAISIAAREKLDNLIFVINCNLQRLDGPVRGNGSIVQELEAIFHGAGWNVIKVLWGSNWDALFARDPQGLLAKRMAEAVDGDYQNYKARGGAYVREHFFGKYPELSALVADMSDDDIMQLERGGHDAKKVYAAYQAAVTHTGQPTVILAKTVKGYGMGLGYGEAENTTHQQKKMNLEGLQHFRDRFQLPIADEELEHLPYCKPNSDSTEIQYLLKCRAKLGGFVPSRRMQTDITLEIPALDYFATLLEGTQDRSISTTMAFVRIIGLLLKHQSLHEYVVPIIPDEARTFGMEGLFRQIGIYSPLGQLYEPVDMKQVMYYREDSKGQLLEEGINEAGAFASWLAAATSYSSNNRPMIPMYIFYSMFGMQRIGDLAWAAGDMRARGFLLGATAGRTTLAGEGLQHQDGHSHLLASAIPNCKSYDPTYAYELAVIMHDGLRRMYAEQEDVYYYLTLMNENYQHPAMPAGVEADIIAGMYLLQRGIAADKRVQLLGSGAILREALAAAEMLATDYGIAADVWSVTSFNELARDGMAVKRWNMLHPAAKARQAYVTTKLTAQMQDKTMPVIAVSDYVRAYMEQIREYVPTAHYTVLGTDGFGRSDTRQKLRHYFEVDSKFIVVAALKSLHDAGIIAAGVVAQAIANLGIDPEKPNPYLD